MNVEQKEKLTNLSHQMRNFISGLIAGFISVTVCNPLDIARTRLNVLVSSIITRMPLPIIARLLNTLISRMPCRPFGSSKAGEVFIAVHHIKHRLPNQRNCNSLV